MSEDELCYLPAWRIAELVRSGDLNALDVVDAVLARMERLDPQLNAFVLTYAERTRNAARSVLRNDGRPLAGVPVSIKDTYWSAGLPMNFGSNLLAEHVPQEDSPAVTQLRDAGAIDIGKTNTPEFAWRGSTDCPLHGETANPWNLGLTPGGSSGGGAAAVAAGLGPLALSSDAAGSIRIPASFCGLVGFKATFGRVAMYPPAAGNELALHGGPITRNVRDAALMYQAIARPDPRDPFSLPGDGSDVLDDLEKGIAGLRVAWSPDLDYAPVEPETAAIAADAASAFNDLGVRVAEAGLKLDDPSWILDTLFGGALAGAHASRPDSEKARMDPALVAYAEQSSGITVERYMKAIMARQALVQQLVRFFEDVDLLLTPTVCVPPFPLGKVNPDSVNGRPVTHLGWSLCYPFNWSGQPAISVPAGWTADGLPVGLQIVGRRFEEAVVLRAAAAFERARPWGCPWSEVLGQRAI